MLDRDEGYDHEHRRLDKLPQVERTYGDATLTATPQAIERLCQVWGEVGQAILARRKLGT